MALELLEKRLAPAGVVTATSTGGILTLTGDALDNQLQITEFAPDQLRVTGLSGTTILFNGVSLGTVDVAAVGKGLVLDLKGGADAVTLETASFTGDLTAKMGEGDNDLALSGTTAVGGNLSYTGGGGADVFSTDSDLTVGGRTTLTLGNGDSSIAFRGNDLWLGNGLTISSGNGSDQVLISPGLSATLTGSANFTLGSGGNNVTWSTKLLSISGGMSLTNQAHPGIPSVLLVEADRADIGGNVTVQHGAGANATGFVIRDVLTIRGSCSISNPGLNEPSSTRFEAAIISIGANLSVSNGTGLTTTEITAPDPAAGVLIVGGNLSLINGSNNSMEATTNTIDVGEVKISGKLAITAGNGYYIHSISARLLEAYGGIGITNGNAFGAPLNPRATSTTLDAAGLIAPHLTIANGTGLFATTVLSTQAQIDGNLLLRSAGGTTTTSVEGSFSIEADLKISNGIGNHLVTVEATSSIVIGGDLSVDHASGGPDACTALVTFAGKRFLIADDLFIRYGNGAAESRLGSAELIVGDDFSITHSNSLVGGTNTDSINASELVRVGGNMKFNGAVGEFSHSIDTPSLTVFGEFTVTHMRHVTGTNGMNELEITGGQMAFWERVTSNNTHGGNTRTHFSGSDILFASGLTANHATGSDLFEIIAGSITSRFDINLRNGAGETNTLLMATDEGLNMRGSVIVYGAEGNDTFQIVADGHITGGITCVFGTGATNTNRLTGSAVDGRGLTIGGNISLTAAASTARSLEMQLVNAGQSFSFTGGSNSDAVTVSQCHFTAGFSVNLGAGDDGFLFDHSTVRGGFSLYGGAGADTIGIATGTSLTVPCLFLGQATILLDAGADTLTLGGGATPIFQQRVVIDGGADVDTLIATLSTPPALAAPQFLAGSPKILNIELP